MNIKTTAFCTIAFTSLLLASCVTVYEPAPAKTERTYSAVVSHSDAFQPKPGQTFSWFTDAVAVSNNGSGGYVPQHVQALIAETLETGLIAKGFRVADNPNTADFLIGAGVLVNGAEQSKALLDLVQVFPGIRETLDEDQPVSLLVAAGRPGSLKQHHLMWRGAVNASAITSDIPDAQRQALIKEIASSLLQQFP